MPWIQAMLRGQPILARARDDGTFASENGRVEIRYKPNDGRVYRAAASNLAAVPGAKVLPEETCGPAQSVTPASSPGGRDGAATSSAPAAPAVAKGPPTWIAYTDGACSGNPGPAGSGVVLVSPDGKVHEGFEYLGQATNNVAELTAILRALEWSPPEAVSLLVHTDSQYAIGVLQKGWKAKVNQELVGRAREAIKARRARLVYVPGHRGVLLNERADELAREAVQTGRTHRVSFPAGTETLATPRS